MDEQQNSAESPTKTICCWCNKPPTSAVGSHRCQKCLKPCHANPPCSFSIDEQGFGAKITCFNCWLTSENAMDLNALNPTGCTPKKSDSPVRSEFINNKAEFINNESAADPLQAEFIDNKSDADTPLKFEFIDNESAVQSNADSPTVPQRPRKRRVFTIREKLNILDFAKNSSVHAASRQFKVERSSIQDWRKRETDLRQILESEKRKRLSGGGRKVSDAKFDEMLSNWVREQREKKMRVTRNMIVERAQQLSVYFKNLKYFTASNGWLESFMHRHNISLRPPMQTDAKAMLSETSNDQRGGRSEMPTYKNVIFKKL